MTKDSKSGSSSPRETFLGTEDSMKPGLKKPEQRSIDICLSLKDLRLSGLLLFYLHGGFS
jgi:hypothetical protein